MMARIVLIGLLLAPFVSAAGPNLQGVSSGIPLSIWHGSSSDTPWLNGNLLVLFAEAPDGGWGEVTTLIGEGVTSAAFVQNDGDQ